MASPATFFTDEGTAQRRKEASQRHTGRWHQSQDRPWEPPSPSQPWSCDSPGLLVPQRHAWRGDIQAPPAPDQLSSLAPSWPTIFLVGPQTSRTIPPQPCLAPQCTSSPHPVWTAPPSCPEQQLTFTGRSFVPDTCSLVSHSPHHPEESP